MADLRNTSERLSVLETKAVRLADDVARARQNAHDAIAKATMIETALARHDETLTYMKSAVGEIRDDLHDTKEAAERAAEQRNANRPQWAMLVATLLVGLGAIAVSAWAANRPAPQASPESSKIAASLNLLNNQIVKRDAEVQALQAKLTETQRHIGMDESDPAFDGAAK